LDSSAILADPPAILSLTFFRAKYIKPSLGFISLHFSVARASQSVL
jgi:hypothetical protein